MTERDVEAARERMDRHDSFERVDERRHAVTSTPFDGTVTVNEAGDGVTYDVTVRVPTLNAVVTGEAVAPIVEEDWYETLALRLADAPSVAVLDGIEEPTVARSEETVEVTVSFSTADPERGVADAKALVDYVEGTWIQGVIPGYEYGEPARQLLHRAQQNAEGDESAEKGGTPL